MEHLELNDDLKEQLGHEIESAAAALGNNPEENREEILKEAKAEIRLVLEFYNVSSRAIQEVMDILDKKLSYQ